MYEEIMEGELPMDQNKIYLRIKDKGNKHAEKLNDNNETVKFEIGDLVLVEGMSYVGYH